MPETASPSARPAWAHVGAAALAAFAGAMCLRPVKSVDQWWHLSMGRGAVEAGARRFPDPVGPDPAAEYVAPEWLFDVALYAADRLGGLDGMVALVALCAAAATGALWGAMGRLAGGRAPLLQLGLLALAALGATGRFVPRPQVVYFSLVPGLLWASLWVADRPRRRWPALFGIVGLWAQIHSSVVLAAPLVLAGLAPRGPDLWRLARWGRWRLAAAAGAGLGVLAGPFGLEIVQQILTHTDDRVVEFILDMRAPELSRWDPTRWRAHAPYAAFEGMALGLIGAWAAARRVDPRGLLLAALALALALEATRFIAIGCVLMALAVASGLGSLPALSPGPVRRLGALTLALALLGWGTRDPPSRPQLDPASNPLDVPVLLEGYGVRGQLFNDYDTGALLGWALYGRARVYIDGRTPTFFDGDHFFRSREALADPAAFEALHARHDFAAAVVPTDAPLCAALDAEPGWTGVWRSGGYAVLLPGGAEPFEALRVCDPLEAIKADCRAAPDPAPLRRDLERLVARVPESGSARVEAGVLAMQCLRDLDRAEALWREAAAAANPSPDACYLGGLVALGRDDLAGALERLDGCDALPGRMLSLSLFLKMGRDDLAIGTARQIERDFQDRTPPAAYAAWRTACERAGDAACVARLDARER